MTKKKIGIGFGTWAWGNKLVWDYKAETDDILLKKTFFDAIDGNPLEWEDFYSEGFHEYKNFQTENTSVKFPDLEGSIYMHLRYQLHHFFLLSGNQRFEN